MTEFVPALLPVCGEHYWLHGPLVAVARAFAPPGTTELSHVDRDRGACSRPTPVVTTTRS